jgi:hypothetical protein
MGTARQRTLPGRPLLRSPLRPTHRPPRKARPGGRPRSDPARMVDHRLAAARRSAPRRQAARGAVSGADSCANGRLGDHGPGGLRAWWRANSEEAFGARHVTNPPSPAPVGGRSRYRLTSRALMRTRRPQPRTGRRPASPTPAPRRSCSGEPCARTDPGRSRRGRGGSRRCAARAPGDRRSARW